MNRVFAKLVAPYARRIGNMIARGAVVMANSATRMQELQIKLLSGETQDGVEHFEPFGFTSCPLPGAEHVTLFLGGDRSHGITIVAADRRYRLTGLQGGEAALHDAFGNKVHLHDDGTMEVVASLKVQITSPLVTMSGNLQVTGNIVAASDISDHSNKSMAGMRATYNGHTHSDPQGGSVGTPSAQM